MLNEIQSQLETIEQTINELSPSYVPFNVTLSPDAYCAGPGNASPAFVVIALKSASPFLVNSIRVGMGGIDEAADRVLVTNAKVDGQNFNAFTEGNLVSAGAGGNRWFDVLAGLPIRNSDAKFPLQLASSGGGEPDMAITVSCDAQTMSELVLDSVQVSGWKDPDADVEVTFQ